LQEKNVEGLKQESGKGKKVAILVEVKEIVVCGGMTYLWNDKNTSPPKWEMSLAKKKKLFFIKGMTQRKRLKVISKNAVN